jgi:hypothetical protein
LLLLGRSVEFEFQPRAFRALALASAGRPVL